MFEYWFMFPIGMLLAAVAMMLGIGGAVFFAPLFFLVLKLRPDVALGTGVVTEFFGISSGFIGYARRNMIDFTLGKQLLRIALPGVVLGVIVGKWVASFILQTVFGIAMILLALALLHKDKVLIKHPRYHEHDGSHTDAEFHLHKDRHFVRGASFLGGLSLGALSSGLGEINEYNFLKKLNLPTGIASGTSVYVIMIAAFVASLAHGVFFIAEPDIKILQTVGRILLFTVPGVVIGAQIGVRTAGHLSHEKAKYLLSGLLLLVGLISFV